MGLLAKITGLLGGGAASAVNQVADVVERWKPSAAKTHEMQMGEDKQALDEVASARGMIAAPSHETLLDAIVDGFNRMIRPGVTVLLVGAVMGWWKLPDPGSIDPFYLVNAERALVFWFGGRALFRDLPDALAYYKAKV